MVSSTTRAGSARARTRTVVLAVARGRRLRAGDGRVVRRQRPLPRHRPLGQRDELPDRRCASCWSRPALLVAEPGRAPALLALAASLDRRARRCWSTSLDASLRDRRAVRRRLDRPAAPRTRAARPRCPTICMTLLASSAVLLEVGWRRTCQVARGRRRWSWRWSTGSRATSTAASTDRPGRSLPAMAVATVVARDPALAGDPHGGALRRCAVDLLRHATPAPTCSAILDPARRRGAAVGRLAARCAASERALRRPRSAPRC